MVHRNRRNFLTAGVGMALGPLIITNAVKVSANERVQHAVIGTGGQGSGHVREFSQLEGCRVTAVCDVDSNRLAKAARSLPEAGKVRQVEDYRRILEDSSIDTVSIATPDHWHSKIAIEAIQAGKHVYVEKPCSHNIQESEWLLQAAEKHAKCVQHGTQSRSGKGIQDAVQFMREGGLGKVRLAKAINHQFRRPIGSKPVSTPPEGVNYDLWLGPAPEHPFTENRWHYNWHWFWDYGTGDMGNDGIHQVDVARWGLGGSKPNAVSAAGGQLLYQDDHQTPDTQIITFEFHDCYLVYEMRLWTDYKMEGHDNGTVFYGDRGRLDIGREGCILTLIDEEPRKIGGGSDFGENIRNFITCVKNNTPEKLNAPVSEGVLSANLCHWGNIATRISQRIDLTRELTPEAAQLVCRDYRQGYEIPEV
ncbi:MAG: Gfo/Idh/MocA family protein [bacterium]|jgi:predicted dehydrogenase